MSLVGEDSQLLLAILPVFVYALPPAPEDSGDSVSLEVDTERLDFYNALTNLRFEIQELPKVFTSERIGCQLPDSKRRAAMEAIEEILYSLDDLVDRTILPIDVSSQSKLLKLNTLMRGILSCNLPPQPIFESLPPLPDQLRKWIEYIKYDRGGKHTVQYRRTFKEVKQFNNTMRETFSAFTKPSTHHSTQVFQRSRHDHRDASADDGRDNAEIHAAKKLCDAATSLARRMTEVSEPCDPLHTALICLSGFEEPKIDTIMTLCGPGKAERWHCVQWTLEARALNSKASRTIDTICDELRSSRKYKRTLHVNLRDDGSWDNRQGSHMTSVVTAPKITLDRVLKPKKKSDESQIIFPELKKKDRLDLALRIARSFLCLLWSPLLQSPWLSETIYMSQFITESGINGTQMKPYVTGRLSKDNWCDETTPKISRKNLILELGVLLWELFFHKVTITSEDVEDEEDEEDETLSLYNALNREQLGWRDSVVEDLFPNIIEKCLDLFANDELDHAKLRSQIYHGIVKPLRDYLEVLNGSAVVDDNLKKSRASSVYPKPVPATSPILNYAQQLATKLEPPSIRIQAMPPRFSVTAPIAISTTLTAPPTADLLASTGNIKDSASWLHRFDLVNQHLKELGRPRRPVQIAILDTGCDLDNDFFAGHGIDHTESITENWIDFVDGSAEPVDDDPGRHGTALVALALRLVPSPSSVHVIRVAKDAGELLGAKERVVKAIHHAVTKCDADIVSMSFGFGAEVKLIQTAIEDAERHKGGKVLFFAAANNDGLNALEMFPAFSESVISVRGTTCTGEFVSQYDPSTWGHKAGLPQYGTLAVDVACGVNPGCLVKAGCSVATPILAAIAAVVISLADLLQVESSFDAAQDLVRTRRGMLSIFKYMTERQGDRKRLYLAPSQLYEQTHGKPAILLAHALSTVAPIDTGQP